MTLVAIADDPMVTICPPSSIALIRRPRMPISRVTSAARVSPDISSACMRAREAAVSAVSAPAKNAAKAMLTTMTAMSSEIGMDKGSSTKAAHAPAAVSPAEARDPASGRPERSPRRRRGR